MKFAIANCLFWIQKGYDITHWRTSVDGKLAMCHTKFAEALVGDILNEPEVTIYDVDSEEFRQVIADHFTEHQIVTYEEEIESN